MEEGLEEESDRLLDASPQEPSGGLPQMSGHLAGGAGSDHGEGLIPVHAAPRESSRVIVPTTSEMELMLAKADDGDSLAALVKATAALVEIAKRQNLIKKELFGIAEWHLRVKRKLGAILMQTVSWGGDRSRCHDDILLPGGLPKNLNPSAAKRCRWIAEIEESVFQQYLETTRSRSRTPSEAGAIKFAQPGARQKVGRKSRKTSTVGEITVAPGVLDAIRRCLGDIDVCIGEAKVACRRRYTFSTWSERSVSGIVLISAAVDPADWLARAVDWTQRAKCDQVVVLLPADLSASSLRILAGASWQLCFLSNPGVSGVVAYVGARREAFFASMHEHGLVVSVHQ